MKQSKMESRETEGLSRRNFVKGGLAAAVVGAMTVGGIAGCAPSTTSGKSSTGSTATSGKSANGNVSLAPGTYSSTVSSIKGDLTVNTTVSENAITGISVKTVDTRLTAGTVISTMVPSIIANQSYNVDTVSGATFTSTSLASGVKDCLSQAGAGSDDFAADCKTVAVEAPDEEFDAVVVGSGAAGLSSAIHLAKKGAKVVLLEKLGFCGGTTGFSSGGVWTSNTVFNTNTGFNFTPDSLVKHMYDTTGLAAGELNDALIRKVAEVSGEVYDELRTDSAPWDIHAYTFGDKLKEMPVSWPVVFFCTAYENNAGTTLIDALVRTAQDSGVEIRVNSDVTGLLQGSDGKVCGVSVEARDKIYNAHAKKVILATGGFQRNQDLVAELAPQHKTMVPFTGAGSNGDAITMAREVGAQTTGSGVAAACGLNSSIGYVGPMGATTFASSLRVNKEGKRFYNEAAHYSATPDAICSQTDGTVYGIADSANAAVSMLETLVSKKYAYKANTLEELASQIGAPSDTLKTTVESYNAVAASGADDPEFGTLNASMTPAATAPFYAIITHAVSFASLASLKADENCAIVDTKGAPIPNLYGAGEVICGNLFSKEYPGSGSQIGSALYEGRIIADVIAKDLNL